MLPLPDQSSQSAKDCDQRLGSCPAPQCCLAQQHRAVQTELQTRQPMRLGCRAWLDPRPSALSVDMTSDPGQGSVFISSKQQNLSHTDRKQAFVSTPKRIDCGLLSFLKKHAFLNLFHLQNRSFQQKIPAGMHFKPLLFLHFPLSALLFQCEMFFRYIAL